MISTFGGFSTAKLGIRASQQGLQITGNNISNINTNGYTRQRIHQVSLYGSTADRYSVSTDVNMGIGTLVTNVVQIRDPFLDIRYRNEAANLGFYDEKTGNLEELKRVLDEVSKDGVHTAFEGIRTQLQNLASHVGDKEHDTLVRSACEELVTLLNKYAADLKAQKETSLQGFNQNVDEVNNVLKQIQDLNKEIRKSQIHGDNASELLDNRNLLIDRLAEMTKINVSYEKEQIAQGIYVDRLIIKMDAPGQDPANRPTLIDGEFANKLEIKPLGQDGKPDPNSENYEINLGGLTNSKGETPLLVKVKEQMDYLNSLTKSMQGINQDLSGVNQKLTAWNAKLTPNFKADDFDRTPGTGGKPSKYDEKVKELDDALKKATEDYRKNPNDPAKKQAYLDAQKKQSDFNKLAEEKQQLDKQKASLEKDFNDRFSTLEAKLKEQGLTATKTPNADGTFTVQVTGGTPAVNKTLIDGTKPNDKPIQFGAAMSADGKVEMNLDGNKFGEKTKAEVDQAANKMDVKEEQWAGVLKADLEYLNGKGEFGNPPSQIRGIAYYQRSLDTLAQSFAKTMNEMNRPLDLDKDGKPQLIDPNDPTKGYKRKDADLFESGDPNNQNITASNIKISKGWEDGTIGITNSVDPSAGDGDNSNILNMIQALNKDQKFYIVDKDGNPLDKDGNKVGANGKPAEFFTGSFEGMFTNMNAVLGSDMNTTNKLLNNAAITTNDRAVARDNVSSVDLNEEGINLVQYQKAFQAACRVMTTLDEMLQSVLNIGVGG